MWMMQENSRIRLDTESTDQILGNVGLLSADNVSGVYLLSSADNVADALCIGQRIMYRMRVGGMLLCCRLI